MLHSRFAGIRAEVHDTLKQYSQRSYVCHCLKGVGAFQLEVGEPILENDQYIVVGVSIAEPKMFMDFSHRCDCSCKYTNGDLKIDKNIWRANLHFASEIRAANLLWDIQDECIHFDSTHALAIMVPVGIMRVDNDNVFTYGEVCAGGFSGWSHAATSCLNQGIPTSCKFAVEIDESACNTYCKTWNKARIIRSYSDYAHHVDDFNSDRYFPLFQEDVELGWWISCVSRTCPDAVCVSPPCPPYSLAANGKGLGCNEGWVTLSCIIAIAYLSPKLILLENVAAILKHNHWELIQLVIQTMGYSIVAKHAVNASQVSPQNRDRCLLILAKNNESMKRDVHMVFPMLPNFSLMTFGAIMEDLLDMREGVMIDEKLLAIYLDERYLPKQTGVKRLKMDVAAYRIKLPSETVGCIMASYTFQHELSREMLSRKGLFGNLVQQGQIVRFLTGIECLILMQPQCDCFLPKDRRVHMRIVGNSICTAHAMFLFSTAIIMTKPDLCQKSPHDMVLEVITNRLSMFNSKVVSVDEGWWLINVEDEYQWNATRGDPYQDSIISPTLRDDRLIKIIFETKGWSMTGWIAVDVNIPRIMEILSIEDYKIMSVMQTNDSLRIRFEKPFAIPISQMKWNKIDDDHIVIFACGFWVVMPRDGLTYGEDILQKLAMDLKINTESLQIVNMVGKIIDPKEIIPSTVVITCKGGPKVNLQDMKNCKVMRESGIVSVAMSIREANHFVVALKASHVTDMCQIFGWNVNCIENADPFRPRKVVFRRIFGGIMISTSEFQHLLQLWLLQCTMSDLMDEYHEGTKVFITLKFYGSKIWMGYVDVNQKIQVFMKQWNCMIGMFGIDCPIRIVALGKSYSEDIALSEIIGKLTAITLHMVLPQHGGGAKDDQKFVAKNQLALLLLNKGLPVEKVASVVDQIVQSIGAQRVVKDLKEQEEEKRWNHIQQWMSKIGVNMPEHSVKFVSAAMKIQKAIRRKQFEHKHALDVHSLNIEPDFFVKEDGSTCDILKTLQGAKTGVCLLSQDEANAWINAKLPLSAHELAGLVVGAECGATNVDACRKLAIPVTDTTGQPLIIRVCMHQLGSKKIQIEKKNAKTVVVEKSVIVSLTVFRDECQNDLWPMIVKNPVKTVIGILESDGPKSFACSAPWGRSWRNGSQPCDPHDASSLQFHIRVKETALQQLLKISGRSSIYITPKDDQVGLLKGWAVVWMRQPKAELHIALAKLEEEHGGIVRTSKGLGIRVKQSTFQKAFTILRPGDRVPMVLEAKKLFRLQPVPVGASNEDIEQITSKHGWKTRALKSLGPHAWMVATEDDPPSQWLPVNDMVILVKPIEASKQISPPTIVAGRTRPENIMKKENDGVDPWTNKQHDPWANYQASGVSQSISSMPKTPSVAASSDNPTVTKKLQDQEAKLKSLEQQVGKLAAMQQKSSENQEIFQKDTEARFTSIRDDLCDQMSKVSTSFQSSLNLALQKHDIQISNQFQELKDLFMSSKNCGGKTNRPLKVHKGQGKAANPMEQHPENPDTEMGASPMKHPAQSS